MAKEFTKKIILENGREFYGYGFGANVETINELVFNTSMAGYQEIVSDPACTNEIVCMTYPLIGNYGVTDEDYEARVLTIGGIIVREYNDIPSNFRFTKTLSEILEENNVPAISGVDTRAITRIIRDEGSQKAMITSVETSLETALEKIKAYQIPTDTLNRVSCKKRWYSRTPNHKYDVVVIDCGVKHNIIRLLNEKGCNVTIVPFDTTAEAIMSLCPDGVLVSNGPGNPEDAAVVIDTVKTLRGKIPMFGISLGHQIIALAHGAKIVKMKFGHGGDLPVRNIETGKLEITSQNHSYAVDTASLDGTGLKLTHTNLLYDIAEGIENADENIFSVQYHPESAPGPHDSEYLFDKFIDIMAKEANKNA